MSLESAEVVIGATGHIWRGVLGTAFPTNVSTVVNETLWTELGYLSEDGPQLSFDRNVNEIMGWQSFDPLRISVESVPKEVTFTMMQQNQNTFKTSMGGGTFTEPTANNFVYEPPLESELDQFALIVQYEDGLLIYRYCFRKVQVTSAFEIAATRADAIMLATTCKVLAAPVSGDRPWFLQTNDENLGDPLLAGS